ncbi:2-amino-4-hydroxy-6-hydroxymethyldihydropteridine diphosphokinase [Thioalkalivibrio sp. ALJ9]|uniref:2-amino-4-hydroxy-6- hydroxymethyldihydropteridine diphosphokinase n=1 Tax=Thioalkalivibrio sp. ALJ9 TaxID=1158758 RepID=UPI0009DB3A46|nr:2-amino-4-hydroxy-6-hydroxymethyldihydropteridine diphosphokinase [Thioalkalivibrio sp. ALJ9]
MVRINGIRSYVALGSNLDGPITQVTKAEDRLGEIPQSRVDRISSLYRTEPVGPSGQPDFINAVACLETELSPFDLLDHLQKIERIHQRARGQVWGPRTLDLDLILYGNEDIACERLIVPHQYLLWRSFVLYPLAEIAPDLVLPNGVLIKTHVALCRMERPRLVDPFLNKSGIGRPRDRAGM